MLVGNSDRTTRKMQGYAADHPRPSVRPGIGYGLVFAMEHSSREVLAMRSDSRLQLSLIVRMLVALTVVGGVSILVVGTAVFLSGGLAWVAVGGIDLLFEATILQLVFHAQFPIFHVLVNNALPVAAVLGILLAPVLYGRPVRREIRAFRRELRQTGTRALERDPKIATMAQRLAQQASVPTPDVRIVNRGQPESYAVGGRADGTIVITRAVVRQLSDEELQAVLAHEMSHLANGDSKILNLAVVPMLVAERVGRDERPHPGDWSNSASTWPSLYALRLVMWALVTFVTTVQEVCSRIGIAYLSCGREFAADRGAARLTGSPSSLASALQTLDDERGTPAEDKRTWMRTAGALDILPHEDERTLWGLARTHPQPRSGSTASTRSSSNRSAASLRRSLPNAETGLQLLAAVPEQSLCSFVVDVVCGGVTPTQQRRRCGIGSHVCQTESALEDRPLAHDGL